MAQGRSHHAVEGILSYFVRLGIALNGNSVEVEVYSGEAEPTVLGSQVSDVVFLSYCCVYGSNTQDWNGDDCEAY